MRGSRRSRWGSGSPKAVGEVELSASILQYYADHAETFLAPRPLNSIAGDAYIEYSPLGVLVGVQPWNYPYYQLARFAAPHLTSGNVMLVKHAPGVPQCALAFEQLLLEAGAPRGAYTNAFLSNDQVAKLIDDPRTRGVALTGSERAGESLVSDPAVMFCCSSRLRIAGGDAGHLGDHDDGGTGTCPVLSAACPRPKTSPAAVSRQRCRSSQERRPAPPRPTGRRPPSRSARP